jgi:hypothetical protein
MEEQGILVQKCEMDILGRSGAHKREQREATFTVGPMSNMEVRKSWSLKRGAMAENAPEQVHTCGHRGLHWGMG